MHFDIEPFNYGEETDDHGLHIVCDDVTYTVLFLLREKFTTIISMEDMSNEDLTTHLHWSYTNAE